MKESFLLDFLQNVDQATAGGLVYVLKKVEKKAFFQSFSKSKPPSPELREVMELLEHEDRAAIQISELSQSGNDTETVPTPDHGNEHWTYSTRTNSNSSF